MRRKRNKVECRSLVSSQELKVLYDANRAEINRAVYKVLSLILLKCRLLGVRSIDLDGLGKVSFRRKKGVDYIEFVPNKFLQDLIKNKVSYATMVGAIRDVV